MYVFVYINMFGTIAMVMPFSRINNLFKLCHNKSSLVNSLHIWDEAFSSHEFS